MVCTDFDFFGFLLASVPFSAAEIDRLEDVVLKDG